MKILLMTFFFVLIPCVHADFSKSFPVGAGSQFKMFFRDGGEVNLLMYVANAGTDTVDVEYFMEGPNQVKMWQYFSLKKTGDAPVAIVSGYILVPEMNGVPEKLEDRHFKGMEGVKVDDFLFTSAEDLEKNKKGEETLETPAGKIKTVHYSRTNNGQTFDFWMSAEAEPITLVKAVSAGTLAEQNYTLVLSSLLKNVKAMIDPAKAVPFGPKGKAILEKAPAEKK